MDRKAINAIRVGDRITFKAATRSHCRKATRIVSGTHPCGVTVKSYHGWSDFVVKGREILEHHPVTQG